MREFTLRELFSVPTETYADPIACNECGALIHPYRLEIHRDWHNKVADL